MTQNMAYLGERSVHTWEERVFCCGWVAMLQTAEGSCWQAGSFGPPGSLPICLLPLLITEGQGPNFPRTVWMCLFLLSALSFLLDVF